MCLAARFTGSWMIEERGENLAGFVIGIAGGSGSGKSTLTNRLQQAFPGQVAILRLDDYYKSLSHLSLEERARVNFDHPDALDSALFAQHLAQLRQGQAVQVPLYDFTLHDRKKETSTVFPAPVIIAEGTLLFSYPELKNAFDYRVFVEASDSVRLQRRLRRDVQQRGRTEESVQRQYHETVQPMFETYVRPQKNQCDLIFPGEGEQEIPFQKLYKLILQHAR